MKKFIIIISLVIIGLNCGQPRIEEETPLAHYQVAWVDPQIILSDSLYTLIRAERIDSFLVDEPTEEEDIASSIRFEINQPNCPVIINIESSQYARVVQPVLVKNLNPGFYKFTLNKERYDPEILPPGTYILQLTNCSDTYSSIFTKP